MPNTMNSVELDGVEFQIGDLCRITECDSDEYNLYTSHVMQIKKIYIDSYGDTQVLLFDTRRRTLYGSVIVATPIPKLYQVLTKLEKIS